MSKIKRSLSKQPASAAPTSPLLISESKKKYKTARAAFKDEIQPRGIIEKMYVADITHLYWEIERLRRAKAAILNTAFRGALTTILAQVLTHPGSDDDVEEKAEQLADQWFSEPAAQARVSASLAKYQLDATAIEGQVAQDCSAALLLFDRLLASAESRRQKAVRSLREYRATMSQHLSRAGGQSAKKPGGPSPAGRPRLQLMPFAAKKPSDAA
jgi:hypothetical protein